MQYALLAILGVFSLLAVKVPEGTSPWVFYPVSFLVAGGLITLTFLFIRGKRPEIYIGIAGSILLVVLLGGAVAIIAHLPKP
jgi:hypothetical protein